MEKTTNATSNATSNKIRRFRLNKFWYGLIATLIVAVFVFAFYLHTAYADPLKIWSFNNSVATPIVEKADLDGDGIDEIITVNNSRVIKVFRSDGTQITNGTGTFTIGTAVPVNIAFGDVNGDSKLDIIVPTNGTTPGVRFYYYNGTQMQEYTGSTWSRSTGSTTNMVAFGDYNNDGTGEVIVGQTNGTTVRVYRLSSDTVQYSIFLNQGVYNMIYAANPGTSYYVLGLAADREIYLLKPTTTAETTLTMPNSQTMRTIETGDISNDGIIDFIFGSRENNTGTANVLYVADGSAGTRYSSLTFSALGEINDISIGDVTGDGQSDISMGTGQTGGSGANDRRVRVLDGTTTGAQTTDVTKYSTTRSAAVMAVVYGEFDGDSSNNDLAAAINNRLIEVWHADGTVNLAKDATDAVTTNNPSRGAMVPIKANDLDNTTDLVFGDATSLIEAYTLDQTAPVIDAPSPAPTDISDVSGATYGPSSNINVSVDESVYVTVNVYSDSGRTTLVKTVANNAWVSDKDVNKWVYTAAWDGTQDSGGYANSGTYYYSIIALDNDLSLPSVTSTNRSVYESGSLVLDRTPPLAGITSPVSDGTYLSAASPASVTVTGYAYDDYSPDFVNYSLDWEVYNSGLWNSISSSTTAVPTSNTLGTWNTTSLADGSYRLRLTVNDKYGHTTIAYRHVYIDRTAPQVTLSYYTAYDSGTGVFSNALPLSAGVPITVKQAVYIKIAATEILAANPAVTITGTANNVTGAASMPVTGQTTQYYYKWNITNDEVLHPASGSVNITGQDPATNNISTVNNNTIKVDTTILIPGLSTLDGMEKVTLNWTNDEADHVQYNIWRSTSTPVNTGGAPDFTVGGPVNTWDDTAGTVNQLYYYKIQAVDVAGNTAMSNEDSGQALPGPPTLQVKYYSDAALTQELPKDGSGFYHAKVQNVYIKVTSNKDLTGAPTFKITAPTAGNTLSTAQAMTAISGATVFKSSAAWNVVTEPGADGNATIKFTGDTVQGYSFTDLIPTDGNGGKVIVDTYATPPTLLVDVDAGSGLASLSWDPDSDPVEYYVYRSSTDGFIPDASNKIATVAAPANSYNTTLLGGVTYYRILAVDLVGNVALSNQASSFVAVGPTDASLKYVPNGSYVAITVYWNDINGSSSVRWANDVIASGAELDWKSTGLTYYNLNGTNAYAVLSNAEKYKNYYFKLTKGGQTNIIRAFPVDFSSESGPRYQNDYAHGNYGLSSSMCASCHSTHSGLKSYLLTQSTYYDLCLFCHGTASSQSKYDVVSGSVYTAAGWKDSLAGPIGAVFGTSQHNVDDRSSVDTTVYGSEPGKILTFTCLSCHKAHGGANDNYRLLREVIYPDNDRLTSTTVSYTAYSIVKDAAVGEEVYMVSGNSEFCTACHADYDDGTAKYPGTTYGTASYYRHPVTVGGLVYSVYRSDPYRNWYPTSGDTLPLQVYSSGENIGSDKRTAVVCSTCHFAHGTKKQFNEGYPTGDSTRLWVYNQKMLRLDDYGVCESCHKK